MTYIFRWKECGIEVEPSEAATKEECWAWALKNLRGATEKDSRNVQKNGEVIEKKS